MSRIEPFSPLKDTLKEGMTVHALIIPGQGQYDDLNASELG